MQCFFIIFTFSSSSTSSFLCEVSFAEVGHFSFSKEARCGTRTCTCAAALSECQVTLFRSLCHRLIMPPSSDLWSFFEKLDQATARCIICKNVYSFKSTISNLKIHLKRKHVTVNTSISKDPPTPVCIITSETPIDIDDSHSPADKGDAQVSHPSLPSGTLTELSCRSDPESSTSKGEPKKKQQTVLSGFVQKKLKPNQKKQIDRDLLDLFLLDLQPFTLVEDQGFRKFCKWIPGYELPSRKQISSVWLPSIYHKCLESVQNQVSAEAESICITTDCWSSRMNDSYVAITGHYISKEFEFKSVLLKCGYLPGKHTSANLANELDSVTSAWNLKGKVVFAVADNAYNISGAFESFLKWKHYGCYPHTLNLIVQSALASGCIKTLILKVKAIVSFYKRSHRGQERLLKYQSNNGDPQPKRVIQDVPTRWNSTFYMIQRFVLLEDAIKSTIAFADRDLPSITQLEWKILKDLIEVLSPFEEMSRKMSGDHYLTGSLAIVTTRTLLKSCELLGKCNLEETASLVLRDLEEGLVKRFENIEFSSTYSLCTLLDPRYKSCNIFKDKNAVDKAKKNLKSLVAGLIQNKERDQVNSNPPQPKAADEGESSITTENTAKVRAADVLRDLIGGGPKTVGNPESRAIKEIDSYFNDDVPDDDGDLNLPLKWWKKHQYTYPNLAQIFRTKCNIVASSVPCERVFSKSGNLISEKRTRLITSKIEMIMFVNANSNINISQLVID